VKNLTETLKKHPNEARAVVGALFSKLTFSPTSIKNQNPSGRVAASGTR